MKPYLHCVKYYECDRMGITHHSNYVRFMEEARIDWMDQLGYGFERMEAEGVVSPVLSVALQYKHPTINIRLPSRTSSPSSSKWRK